jgi:hypothetical protein
VGWVSVNCSVSELIALMPEIVCVFWKFAMFAAVGGCTLAFAKYAVSAVSYCCRPAIVDV